MASVIAGRLPVRLVPLVGRQRELQDVVDTLSGSRLLTLTGPGGTGKTRLALAAADAARASYPQGVCWMELAPIDSPAVVALAVASGLGAPESPGQDIAETIAEHVGDRSMLIVLDNCEHLAAAAAQLAERLLSACPGLSMLATSREALGVDGERQLAVPPLALPQRDITPAAAALAQFDSDKVVGTYTVGTGSKAMTHGFTWKPGDGFTTVDDPHGVGTTIINGVNDRGDLVGFYTDSAGNTDGMLAQRSH